MAQKLANRGGSDRHHLRGAAQELAQIGRQFNARGWALGTSGNFSAVTSSEPLRLAITTTGLDKSNLAASQIVEIDGDKQVLTGAGRPSGEAAIHLAIVRTREARAVFHTHSVWSTVLSDLHASGGGITIEGYEMLKGLNGVLSHEHREWLPILENSQDMEALSAEVQSTLQKEPGLHGFLLRRHGLYTWGSAIAEAKRHVEIFEFLMEVVVRSR